VSLFEIIKKNNYFIELQSNSKQVCVKIGEERQILYFQPINNHAFLDPIARPVICSLTGVSILSHYNEYLPPSMNIMASPSRADNFDTTRESDTKLAGLGRLRPVYLA
jgi:hypothetical protein